MGYTVEISCKECNYRKVFNLGRTAKKETLEKVLQYQESEINSAVKQMNIAFKIKDFEYGKQLMLCKNCNAITDENLIIVEFEEADDFISKIYCKTCYSQLKIIENLEKFQYIRCPKCLKYALHSRLICNWK